MRLEDILHEYMAKPLEKLSVRKTKISAIFDMSYALMTGSSLTLTSLGRGMSGEAQVKNKIKRDKN